MAGVGLAAARSGGLGSRGEGIPRHSASGSKPAGLVRPGREPGNRVGGVARRVSAEAGRARFPWLFLTGAPLNRRCWPMFLLLVVVPSANRDIFPIRSIYIYASTRSHTRVTARGSNRSNVFPTFGLIYYNSPLNFLPSVFRGPCVGGSRGEREGVRLEIVRSGDRENSLLL